MEFGQAAIVLLLVAMLILFALDRIRMEIVALGGLATAVVLGVVPAGSAFAGFSNPAFLTVVEILLIVPALGRSGVLDPVARRIPEIARSETGVLALLCGLTAAVSVFMNNIGALALMIPVATSVCRVGGIDRRRVLMPISFAALLGGLCSIIGTPANLIVSDQLAAATGKGFAFFDFAWVGVPAALGGLAAIILWPRRLAADAAIAGAAAARMVVSEVQVNARSPLAGAPVDGLGARVHALRRGGVNLLFQRPGTRVEAGDVLLLEVDLLRLESWLEEGTVSLHAPGAADAERMEAAVMPESTVVGSRIGAVGSLASHGIRVVAVAARTPRIEASLGDVQLSIGDVLHLSGRREALEAALEDTDMLALSRSRQSVQAERRWRPAALFAAGVGLSAFGLAPPLAFGLVVLALAVTGDLNLRTGLAEVDWPILVMLAAMIPLGLAIETTGTAAAVAHGLTSALPLHGTFALSLAMLVLAVVITPFVNNASTAIVLGPIAIGIASASGVAPEPLLIAVALGASVDFLTPVGHQNNTVVMGIAGYRFADFLKAGWPVTVAVMLVAALALWLAWI